MKMKLIFLLVIGTVSCAQLNNNYLPPAGAAAAGGSGPGLQAPKGPGGGSFAGANVPFQPPRAGPGQGPAPPRPAISPPKPGAPAAPSQPSGPPIEIISYENVNNGDGSYKWSYESANGIKAEETGDVKNKGSDNAIQTVQGSYSYTSPEGQVVEIKYTADENGFVAEGDALPLPVPLPEANLKALAEFEAAYATAVPDTAGGQGSGAAGPRPGGASPGGARPGGAAPGGARPGGPAPGGPRPGGPAPAAPRPGGAPAARPQTGGGFAAQPRPAGGSGSGNYNPQSGYSY